MSLVTSPDVRRGIFFYIPGIGSTHHFSNNQVDSISKIITFVPYKSGLTEMILAFTLITSTPIWFIIICIALALAYAILFYHRERHSGFSLGLRRLLGVLRFLSVFILAFLLLAPLFKMQKRELSKPAVVILQDNSESVLTVEKDSAAFYNELSSSLENLKLELGKDFDIKEYSFGENISDTINYSFDQQYTDYSAWIDQMLLENSGKHIASYIVFSDGIYNKGSNPVYQMDAFKQPVHTVRLGDTSIRRDISVFDVDYNSIAYLGNDFPLVVSVRADKAMGKKSRIIIRDGQKIVLDNTIDINSNNFIKKFELKLNADKAGYKSISVNVEKIENEVTYSNNIKKVFVEVLDSKKKILILARAPHPDISALRQAILTNENYESEVSYLKGFKANADDYNLIILHDLPARDIRSKDIVDQLVKSKTPLLFVIGSSTDLSKISKLNLGFAAQQNSKVISTNEALGNINKEFTPFIVNEDFKSLINDLPPLASPFAKYQVKEKNRVLLYQRIGSVTTDYPLYAFSEGTDSRYGFIAGEGVWKWRLQAYRRLKSHNAFNDLINKSVQFLSAKEDKGRFRVYSDQEFNENEEIQFNAELYNESFEPINEPEVELEVRNTDNKRFKYVFSRTQNAYNLNIGRLPVGEYSYTAKTEYGTQKFSASGRFVVKEVDIETADLIAKHAVLKEISERTGGISVSLNETQNIISSINESDESKPLSRISERYNELINMPLVLVLVILLLSLEWFIRKYSGQY